MLGESISYIPTRAAAAAAAAAANTKFVQKKSKHTKKNADSSRLDRFVMVHNILKKNPKKII